jgi:predicted acyltransferase
MDKSKRLIALDVFRGLTIALMVVVNNPGAWNFVYSPLLHSKWHGCTPTDLVFPFFMFIMGTAMWYSFKKFNSSLSKQLTLKIIRRSLIIFFIGIALNMYAKMSVDISHLRIMGVMNRIGLAYGIAAFIILGMRYNYVKIMTAVILLAYWAILVIFGGDSPFSLEGNFAGTFDAFVLGKNHLPGFSGNALFDQTGLLSTLPSLGNVLIGYFAGKLIDKTENKLLAVKKIIIYGIVGVFLAQAWNFVFPINKPLWTSSFVIYTSSLALIFLGVFLWVIDIRGYKKWTHPLMVFGMNPLFIYVFSMVLAISLRYIPTQLPSGESAGLNSWFYTQVCVPLAGNLNGSLLYALSLCLVCWFVGWILYKKSIFIKI